MVEKRTATQSNGIDTYSIIQTVIDVIILQLTFWYRVIEAIIKGLLPKVEASVAGKTILITGTGHGMGKELALQYGALGAKIICWDINEKNNVQTVEEVKRAGGQAYAYTCNVTSRNEINELAAKIKSEHGFVSVVVNNAGIMPCHPILEHTEKEINDMNNINVVAHYWIIQAFLPEMIERNVGNIVALSSCAGLFGLPNLVPYCGTKFAVRGLMEALTEELRRMYPQNNIQLTTIFPYMIDTGLCKKPHYRFPSLFKMVNPKDAAASIIEAQRTGLEEASIPRAYYHIDKIGRLLPKKAMRVISDFLDTGVDSDK